MALVGVLVWMPVSPWLYSGDAFVVAGAAAFFSPASDKWVRLLLPPERYGSGVSLLQVIGQIVKIAGPGLAVTVLARLGPNPRGGFLFDALSFLLSALMVWRSYRSGTSRRLAPVSAAPPQDAAPTAPPPRLGDQWAPLVPIVWRQPLRTLLLVLMVVVLALGGSDVVLVAFTKVDLHIGALDLGYLVSALSVGFIVGSLAAETLTQRLSPSGWLGVGLVGLGGFWALAGVVPVLAVTLAALALSGVFNGLINVKLTTFLPSRVPMALAGRVFALIGTLSGLCQLAGMAVSTGLLAWIGPGRTLVAAGLGVAATGTLGAMVLRNTRTEPAPTHKLAG